MTRFVKLTAAAGDDAVPVPGPIIFNEAEILRVRIWQGGALDKSAVSVRGAPREYIVEESVEAVVAILGADRTA